uniref:Nonstructural protein NS1 n=1 Tax=Aegithalos caudatus ambidensovirus TaxID=2794442 RepID=A0A8E7G1W6_9VIRU|nr:MAG: nonstructural protein NS1 [Aegithalos caudatus ambidensovirus]
MVRLEDSGSSDEHQRQRNKRSSGETDIVLHNEIYGKKARSAGKYGYIKDQTKTLLLKYYCSPLSAVRDIKEFRDDYILSDPKNKDYIQASFDDFGRDLNDFSLREFYEMLSKPDCKPVFIASMEYANSDVSLEWIDNLLKFQFNDDEDLITCFLQSVVDVLDKKVPKCNTICVMAPPSSGKNFFFDMIFAIMLNYGQLGQANKHNLFAFQEAPNKRLLIWNEPNYESVLTDTIKMMLGGDPYTVRVKHCMDTHVRRTPVIILTNNVVPFMVDPAFKDRICRFNWNPAPFLKEYDLKPFPLSFFALLNKYKVSF